MRTTLFLFIIAIFSSVYFLFPVRINALMVENGIDELIKDTKVIVKGKVKSKKSHWTLDGSINTRAVLNIEKSLKGQVAPVIKVEYEGGEVGDIGLAVEDAPSLEKGDNVVLFLEKKPLSWSWIPWRKNIYEVVSLSQGKFLVCENNKLIQHLACNELEKSSNVFSLEELEKKIKGSN